MKYNFVAKSPSDPNGDRGGLGFNSEQEAEDHVKTMNSLIEIYPGGIWNTSFWKQKPEPWKVIKII